MKRVNALLNRSTPSKSEQIPASTDVRTFVHKPLDETKSSLRLVTVNSELSADGSIQCYVSHSTLDRASYVCLSYRWGPIEDQMRININGAPFYVRRNLFEFLEMVRRMPMTFYWIDAICIDQENVSERNHQIAQMGRIYSGAFLVYLWLGKCAVMAPWLQHLKNVKNQRYQWPASLDFIREAHNNLGTCLYNNEYWYRAWIAQEILLARTIVVLLCGESFKFTDLLSARHTFHHVDFGSFHNCGMTRFEQFLGGIANFRHEPLIRLLEKFRDSLCEIPRDRIYSLLSISSDSQLLRVDYEQPSDSVAYEVLMHSDGPLCVCSALLVAQSLGLANTQYIPEPSHSQTCSSTILDFTTKRLRFDKHAMLANDEIQSWDGYKLLGVDIFGHDYVFSHFCPAFELLMDGLQERAIQMRRTPVNSTEDPLGRVEIPFLLKMMDEEHRHAFLGNAESTMRVTAHGEHRDACTVSVALELLAELVPQPIQLCPRTKHVKDRAKPRGSVEVASCERDDLQQRALSAQRRGSNSTMQNVDLRRIDSAHPAKIVEEDGPVSQLRIWRIQKRPG
ncbi:hypothetical protein HBH64_013210 [Parastagonospora nodorum]|nr:hypothetical protein HBH51_008680 [Parastagonospora nodorum]KAH4298631.1 hypothetical protein HBI01_122310 [Parastagonospora nodorum]KAH4313543.1 hypothetical protein HBI02_075780 [Parastagonospora nodorum]KAH4336212.1 hypothetical protein HBI00_029190 [Parastagonospora nodorum]KAH4384670.1 hypothetical protein HBH94_056090 [Parastagonospora nodorum]